MVSTATDESLEVTEVHRPGQMDILEKANPAAKWAAWAAWAFITEAATLMCGILEKGWAGRMPMPTAWPRTKSAWLDVRMSMWTKCAMRMSIKFLEMYGTLIYVYVGHIPVPYLSGVMDVLVSIWEVGTSHQRRSQFRISDRHALIFVVVHHSSHVRFRYIRISIDLLLCH